VTLKTNYLLHYIYIIVLSFKQFQAGGFGM